MFNARRLIALIVIVLASSAQPTAKAFPQAWPMVESYAAQGMTVTMTADCYTDYGLVIAYDLAALDTRIKTVVIDLDYAGFFESTHWVNITPYPGDNARVAYWAPEYVGRNARIVLSGWAPCSTKIGLLRSVSPSYMARILHN